MSPVPTSDNAQNPTAGGEAVQDPMQATAPPASVTQLPTAALELAAKVCFQRAAPSGVSLCRGSADPETCLPFLTDVRLCQKRQRGAAAVP